MYARILVLIDGYASGQLALDHAGDIVHACNATLVLLHIVGATADDDDDDDDMPHRWDTGERLLAQAADSLRIDCIEVDTVLRRAAMGRRLPEQIALLSVELGCDVMVVGMDGRRDGYALLFWDDGALVQLSPVTVILVRQAHSSYASASTFGAAPLLERPGAQV